MNWHIANYQLACIVMYWWGSRLYNSFDNNLEMKIVSMAKNNSQEMFVDSLFKDVFQDKVMAEYDQNQQAFEKLVGADEAYYKLVYTLLAKDLYKSFRSKV